VVAADSIPKAMSVPGPSTPARRHWSIALAAVGALLALVGGTLLYARANIFDRDALAGRAESALSDQRVRLAVAQPITDAILDSGPAKLVNARPVVESVVTGALGTPQVRGAVGESVKALAGRLFDRDPDALLLNLAEAGSLALQTVESVDPQLAQRLPGHLRGARIEITSSVGPIDTLQLADRVRLGGILLPALAILALLGSVAIAADRRRALVRCGISVAIAAVGGLVLLSVGKSLLLGQFDDDLVGDAVSAVWDALLGDLRSAFLFAGVISIVLAASARFTAEAEFDPLAPFVRAGELLRRRSSNPYLGGLRAIALAAIGLALILRPELSLESIAVVAGAWALYVAIGEILAILAPPIPASAAGPPRRRLRPGRVGVAGGVAAVVLVLVLVIPGGGRVTARAPGAPEACNGFAELCSKRIDEVTFAATHNSMSAAQEPGWFLPNQRYGITRQLDDGIRGLLIDTHYGIPRGNGRGFGQVITDLQQEGATRKEVVDQIGEEGVRKAEDLVGKLAFDGAPGTAEPYLCHVLCELGATRLDTALGGIDRWMIAHPDEFLVIFIEDAISPEETAAAFEKSGLLDYAYIPDGTEPPPTLGELIGSDRRLLVMAENDSGGGRFPWYQQGFDLVQETPYTFHTVKEIESPQSCRPNRGSPSNPLFQMNSWIETIPRDPDLAGRIDAHEPLLDRARTCTKLRGLKPNLIPVDFYERGDVLGVANRLNGLPSGAQPSVRTSR
jgi:hypothetical protein